MSIEDIIMNLTHPTVPTRITLLHAEVRQVCAISKRQLQRHVARLVVNRKLEHVKTGTVEGYCRRTSAC